MIVRDSARTLADCLASIRPWVDEMIVVDTGSRDDTPAIVERFGARLFHFPWCDDFSAARNESLRHARGEWLFWMDSDDTIDVVNGQRLRDLSRRAPAAAVQGYVMQVHCPGTETEEHAGATVVDHIKMFRNLPDLRFEGRIHEQILPSIRRAGGEVEWTDIFVVHSGFDHSPAGLGHKRARDLRLLELDLADRPEHPFVLFNLGMTYCDAGDFARAADYLDRGLRVAQPHESHVRKAYALLVVCLSRLDQGERAQQVCRRGLQLFPDDPELLFRMGLLAHRFGHLREAEANYRRLLVGATDFHFKSIDRGILGFKARQNLAAVCVELGDLAGAEALWQQVVDEVPRSRAAWRGLAGVLLRQRKLADVSGLAERLCADESLRVEGLLLQADVAMASGDLKAAERNLMETVRLEPGDLTALKAWCQFTFNHGELGAAESALKQLAEKCPNDGAVQHNLATIHLRAGRFQDAIQCYRQSLRLRPNSPQTHLYLGIALEKAGRVDEATTAWNEVRRLVPGSSLAAEAAKHLARVGRATARDEQG